MSNTVSKPTKERTEDPEHIKAPNLKLEAIREAAEDLKLESGLQAAEDLRLEALGDRIKDPEREAKIEKLESAGDLFEEARPLAPDRDDRREKYTPAKVEKGWFVKTERAQRRVLQKKLGSYRPEPDDPVNQKPSAKAVVEGSLFDLHPLSRVRKRDVEATGMIRAAIPAPLPVKPAPAPEPIKGRCWECYKPLRKRDRAGTKFCTDNMGECRKAYNSREADRDALNEIFKDWSDSRHDERMRSVYRLAAEAMWRSAHRCGIKEGTFVAAAVGVLAVHANPFPPIEPQGRLKLQAGDGYTFHRIEITATATDTGTLFTFEIFSNLAGVSTTIPESPCRPEGFAIDIALRFRGDPGVEWTSEAFLTRVPPLPPGAAMYAARNGRAAEYLAARKRDLAA